MNPLLPDNIARREAAYAAASHCVRVDNVKLATDAQLRAAKAKIKQELKCRGLK